MTIDSRAAPGSEGSIECESGNTESGVHGGGVVTEARVLCKVGESREPLLRAGEGKARRARGRRAFWASAFDDASEAGPIQCKEGRETKNSGYVPSNRADQVREEQLAAGAVVAAAVGRSWAEQQTTARKQ